MVLVKHLIGKGVTDSNGECSVVYNSQGTGDVDVEVDCMNLQETYGIEDYYLYDDASSDKSSHFGSNVSLRNSGTGTLSYDSTNHNYNATVVNTGESFIPITSATGLNDFTLEASLHFPLAKDDYLNGLIIYKDSNNWKRLSYMNTQGSTLRRSEGTMSNGSFNEGTIVVQSRTYTGKWLSFKATITNGTLSVEIKDGATTLDTYSVNISGLLTNNTNFGFNCLWASGRVIPFKNIKIKSL